MRARFGKKKRLTSQRLCTRTHTLRNEREKEIERDARFSFSRAFERKRPLHLTLLFKSRLGKNHKKRDRETLRARRKQRKRSRASRRRKRTHRLARFLQSIEFIRRFYVLDHLFFCIYIRVMCLCFRSLNNNEEKNVRNKKENARLAVRGFIE